jgi:hypothetical protein
MKRKKYVTLECAIPNGTAASTLTFKGDLPKDFDRVSAVAFLEKSAGGLTKYDVSVDEYEGKTTIDYVDRLALVVTGTNSMAIPPSERFNREIFFPIEKSNKKTQVTIKTSAQTTSELSLQVVFECEADN